MALTKEITKLWPRRGNRNIFTVGINFVLKDNGDEVVNRPVTSTYAEGQDPSAIEATIIAEAQALIDKYIAEKNLNSKPAYTASVTNIGNGLSLGE